MTSLFVFGVATLASLVLGALIRRVAPTVGAVVPPRPDRWHEQATPTMGGVAIAAATAVGLLAAFVLRPGLRADAALALPVSLAAAAMFVVGVLDDRLQLSALAKLVSSLIVGTFLIFAMSRTSGAGVGIGLGQTLVATVWFAGVCHALNLLDNMDGLATGVAFIASAFLVLLLAGSLGPALMLLLVALAGALLGFLYWNRHRARLFMGDCGSLFIGAVLAGAALAAVFEEGATISKPAAMAILVLVVPLFDTGFVLILRRLAGRPATRGGTDHVSHRLVSLGFSERSAVRILYLLGLAGGVMAWAFGAGNPDTMLPVVALFVVVVTIVGVYLARVPAYNAEDFLALQKSSFAPFLKDLTFRWHAAEVMLDLVLIPVCYYFAYWLRFEDAELVNFLPFFGASLPVMIGLKLASLYLSGLYQRSWETFGLRDVGVVLRGVALGSALSVLAAAYLYRLVGFSRGVFVLDALLLTISVVATRASFRAMNLVASSRNKRSRRVLVYGAGAFGQLLVREMRANPDWKMNPVAFIDDDPTKAHRRIDGVPVRGALDHLESALQQHRVDEVVLSSPSINGNVELQIRDVCRQRQLPVRRLHMEIR